jgi:hypothetical protein
MWKPLLFTTRKVLQNQNENFYTELKQSRRHVHFDSTENNRKGFGVESS